jgi:hypothetical protein
MIYFALFFRATLFTATELPFFPALDTLAVMGNFTEFKRVYHLIADGRCRFDESVSDKASPGQIKITSWIVWL